MDKRLPEDIIAEFEALPAEEQRRRLLLIPDYGSAYNDLVKPNQATLIPNYFYEKWAHTLGPVATTLYALLRRRCYYHWSRKEDDRDIAFPSQETLGAEAGVKSPKTIRNALSVLEQNGLISRKPQYRMHPELKRPQRTTDRITVYFEVPLVPEDLSALLVREAQRIVNEEPGDSYAGRNYPHRTEGVDKPSYTGRNYPYDAGQNLPRKKYREEIHNNVNVDSRPSWDAGNGPIRDEDAEDDPTGILTAKSAGKALLRLHELDRGRRGEADYALEAIVRFVTDFDRSRRFYEKAAANVPADTIRTIISDLEAMERDQGFTGWKRSKNAAFVSEVMKVAGRAGLNLRKER